MQTLVVLNEFVVLQVRVVEVPGVSMELCGGTHVSNTSEIRGFRIISEQGIASGIRRIEAVAGEAFIEYVTARDSYIKQLCSTLKVCFLIFTFHNPSYVLKIYNWSAGEPVCIHIQLHGPCIIVEFCDTVYFHVIILAISCYNILICNIAYLYFFPMIDITVICFI